MKSTDERVKKIVIGLVGFIFISLLIVTITSGSDNKNKTEADIDTTSSYSSSYSYSGSSYKSYQSPDKYYYATHKPDYKSSYKNSKARENLDDNAHGYAWLNP